MFDIDQFVADCSSAVREHEPRLAIKEVLERAVRTPANATGQRCGTLPLGYHLVT